MCTRKRNVWMMEIAIGILERTPGDERAGDCEAALSSGVPDAIKGLDALQWVARHMEIINFQKMV